MLYLEYFEYDYQNIEFELYFMNINRGVDLKYIVRFQIKILNVKYIDCIYKFDNNYIIYCRFVLWSFEQLFLNFLLYIWQIIDIF